MTNLAIVFFSTISDDVAYVLESLVTMVESSDTMKIFKTYSKKVKPSSYSFNFIVIPNVYNER